MRSRAAFFPGGLTGAGLLVLRFSIAISAIALAAKSFSQPQILQCLGIVAAVGLCAGFQTRALAGLSLLASLLGVITAVVPVEMGLLHAIFAVSLMLTGPGAFSADARLFGRRTITLPDRDDSHTIE
jgi:putative oxidoreductase